MNSFNRIIGFIGLGAMGSRLVRRLIDAGFEVIVFDRTHKKAQAAAAHGATVAPTPHELAAKSGVIMSCLSNDDAVRAIYGGVDGVIAAMPPGSIIIEMSTVAPETSRNLSQVGKERGVEVLDVAISGGPPMVEEGSLTLLGGGERPFKDCQPIFAAIARQYFHLGPSGAGTAMKLVVNTVLGVSMQAIAEAIALGERLGIERGRLLDVLSHTAVMAPAHAHEQ